MRARDDVVLPPFISTVLSPPASDHVGHGQVEVLSRIQGRCSHSSEGLQVQWSLRAALAIAEHNSDHPHPPYWQKYAPKICHTMGVCMALKFD